MSDSRIGFFSASVARNTCVGPFEPWVDHGSNYKDRVVALRYVYVLDLSIWFRAASSTVGAIIAPISDVAVRRFYVTSTSPVRWFFRASSQWRCLGPAHRASCTIRGSGRHAGCHAVRRPGAATLSVTLLALTALGGLACSSGTRDGTLAA